MSRDELLGRVLVVLQFALIGAIAWQAAPAFASGTAPLLSWLLLAAGVGLGSWALGVNKPGNFNIRPTPKAGAQLVLSGPYRWIRHPMYSAILIAGQAGVTTAPNAGQSLLGLLWVAMLAVLLVKLLLEERHMLAQYPAYAAYKARTKRLLPGLY